VDKGVGNIMKNPIIMAIILSSSFLGGSIGLVSTAGADDAVFDNQKSAVPISDKQFSDMDQLRGIIGHTADNPIIGYQFNKNALSVSEIQMEKRGAQKVAISLETLEPLIDRVMTGQSNRSMLFQKFDSNGLPMAHHQEYARPSAKSLASSIWDAIDLNPYPGE
jgi:hypothetical protein